MQILFVAAVFMGTIPTEHVLLNQKTEESYHYISQDNRKLIGLTFMHKKGIFQPQRHVILQVSMSLKPWRDQLFTEAWKGTYTVKQTPQALLVECRFRQQFETGIKGGLVQNSYFRPKTITFHIEKYQPEKHRPSIQLYFTAEKVRKLHYWKAKEKITLY